MNKFLGGACVLALAFCTGVAAHAGDFKGFYVGLNAGGNSGNTTGRTTTVFSPTGYFATSSVPAIATAGKQDLSASSFHGSGAAGFNLQHKSFVFGVETDIGSMNASKQKTTTMTYPCCAPTAFTITQFAGTGWLYTLRPRVGFTGGPVLVYGTGGLALTNVDYTTVFTDTFATALETNGKSSTQAGWAAGGGLEFKPGRRWSVKGEYLRSEISTSRTSTNLTAFTPRIAFPTNVFTHKVDVNGNLYRFGFNFYF